MRERYGLLAEFGSPQALVEAARRARESGLRRLDGYSPYPVAGLAEALGERSDRGVYGMVLAVMIVTALLVYLLQVYTSVWDYPINVSGKPYNAWPAFIPSAVVLALLLGGLAAALTLFAQTRLPRLYHPVFNARNFDLSGPDRFYLCVEASDPRFDAEALQRLFDDLHALAVEEVER